MALNSAATARPIRIRLQIQRNDLPTVQTLWPIPATSVKRTIAQLLEEINATFPLESDTWGLEHYTITIGGYECLHYHPLGDVLKDEDEVVVRPLLTSEVRARKVLGRDQIAGDGRHMLDGLPWGRAKVKGIYTPKVRIPPRKRRRIDDHGSAAVVEEDDDDEDDELQVNGAVDGQYGKIGLPRLLDAELPSEDEDDEDEDEDNEDEDEDNGNENEDEDDEDEDEDVSFASDSSEDSSSDSEANDSEDEDEEDTSDTSSGASSGSDSTPEEQIEPESWHGIEEASETAPSEAAAHKTELGSRMIRAKTASQNDQNTLKPTLADSTTSKTLGAKVPTATQFVGIPNTGSEHTKSRNARRRDQKELRHLKGVGVLPSGASLADLRDWKARNGSRSTKAKASPAPKGSHTAELQDDVNGDTEKDTSTETFGRSPPEDETMIDEASTPDAAVTDTAPRDDFEAQRKKLLQAIHSGGVEIDAPISRPKKRELPQVDGSDEDDAPEEMSTKAPAPAPAAAPALEPTDQAADKAKVAAPGKAIKPTDMVPSSVANRSRLNLDSSRRLLFGSLGVRVPKTQQEEAALQKRLADRNKRVARPTEAGASRVPLEGKETPAPANSAPEDPNDESWRDKIELSAVECCEEGVVLSTPPFPFHQRWDPQQRGKKARGRVSSAYLSFSKKRKRGAHSEVAKGEYVETYDKYNTDGTGDALDYDDVEDDDDEYWEEGALLDDDYDDYDDPNSHVQTEASNHQTPPHESDDFPPLPTDISALPTLPEPDAKPSDVVIYQELVCSAATNWQPTSLTRTVRLKARGDEGEWHVVMAMRDLRPRRFDAEGNRVYEKFEMEGLSDGEEEGEEREKIVAWGALGEVRLLSREEGSPDKAEGAATIAAVD
ncbi:histone acetyltransferase KAT6B-like [Teratosphaeria destructans]|uniref:Histone acetyltransferase KAT6B-like n=1 Tax=Teratosphaeria destructans TaxID=418781 RepID=A0A9W7VYN4_9PEZI|nr:histone acetyltransferase KAT6B-like [Teratosphaeria destructans]